MSERTRVQLVIWGRAPHVGENLAAELLKIEGYVDIVPSRPKGGPDGGKDVLCQRLGVKYVVACHFPNNSHRVTFQELRSKFLHDLKGIERNDAKGFIFVTNVDVTEGNKIKLDEVARHAQAEEVQIYDLERLRALLDSPICYGLRLRHLELNMTNEELVAFFQDTLSREHAVLREELVEVRQQLARLLPLPVAAMPAQVEQALSDAPTSGNGKPGGTT